MKMVKQKKTTKKSQWWKTEKIGFDVTLAETRKQKLAQSKKKCRV
jgi:hypothetical protein